MANALPSRTALDRWPSLNGTRNSDSDTERGNRSTSRSDPDSVPTPSAHANGHVTLGQGSAASLDTAPDPVPQLPHWSAKRHLTCGNPTPSPAWSMNDVPWRASAPGKLKTANAALVLCLNIDVDPPDVIKTNPCATMECWVDPHSMPAHKALEAIGTNLQHQFEGLSLKIPYKPILDPSYEDLRRFCQTLRKQAKDDTVLFYYNGHGVPKPTASGELWCFNRAYTQYIPVSLGEVQSWLLSPGVFIWDCSGAGSLLQNFTLFAERRDQETNMHHGGYPDGMQPFLNCLQLAACAAHESLPSCPELPADIFTACLTSPIDIALRFFMMSHQLPSNISNDMVMQLPGDLKDRRTPLGELNWIFTAITDTIAWTTFPRDLFTRLYRSDLLIASLFRNFLLAERIMKSHHCTPHTYPPLPATNTHPMWAAWDLAVDVCIRQLPDLFGINEGETFPKEGSSLTAAPPQTLKRLVHTGRQQDKVGIPKVPETGYKYVPSRFFADQLTAFEVWISRGGSALTRRGPMSLPQNGSERASPDGSGLDADPSFSVDPIGNNHHLVPRKPPDQLPIVLQVLLSQPHRLRALILLSQFVDLGPWAVHLVLAIGIFPYISKLLQAAGVELRPVLIFIWARILAVDPSVQTDLCTNHGYRYFCNILAIVDTGGSSGLPNVSEHKAMCAFILSAVARNYPAGQMACMREHVLENCFIRLDDDDFLLRQWCILCIGQLWDANDENKIFGVDLGVQDKLINMLADEACEVRTAALFSLGTFMGATGSAHVSSKQGGRGTGTMHHLDEQTHLRMEVAVVTGAALATKDDASPMVRKELLVVISCLVKEWRGFFVVAAWIYWEEDRKWRSEGESHLQTFDDEVTSQAVSEWLDGFGDEDGLRETNRVLLSSIFTLFVTLLELSVDPYQEVATNAQTIVDYIMALLLESPFTRLDCTSLDVPPMRPADKNAPQEKARSRPASLYNSPVTQPPASPALSRPGIVRSDTMNSTSSTIVNNTIRRTTSFANALKSLAGTIAFPSADEGRSSPHLTAQGQSRSELADVSRPPSPNLNVAQYASPYSQPQTPHSHHAPSPRTSPRSSSELPAPPPMDFLPSDVMEALIEEDMERLRARRRASHSRRHQHHYDQGGIPSPSGSTFSMDSSASSVILGLGTGVGIRDVLPLKSTFYDWCCEYFKEPQMRQAEADEPGSIQYNYQVWRQQRNEQIESETLSQVEVAQRSQWDKPVATMHMPGHPLTMAFHAYDRHMIVGNDTDMIGVWDWGKRKRLNYFCNGNARGASITSLLLINQEVGGIILTGSADGAVRLFRNYDPTLGQGPVQMVSSFRGLNEMVKVKNGSGLILDWRQSAGSLSVSGDSRIIRIWDAHTETQVVDIDTLHESPVTAISSDPSSSSMFLASFADGTINIYDRRLDPEEAVVRTYEEHQSWVQNAKWHPTYGMQFLSGSLDGEVKLWDMRGADRSTKTWDYLQNGLSSFDVHPKAAVFAATSALTPTHWRYQRAVIEAIDRSHTAKVMSSTNIPTGMSAFPARGHPSPFIPRSTAFAFHPTEMLYGVGEPDGHVKILGCKFHG